MVSALHQGQGKLCPPAALPALSNCPAEVDNSVQLPGPAWRRHRASSVPILGPPEDLHTDRILSRPWGLFPYFEHFWGDWTSVPHGLGGLRPQREESPLWLLSDQDVSGTPRQKQASFGALARCPLW